MEQQMNKSMVESPKKRPLHHAYDDIVGSFSFSSSSSEISTGSSSSSMESDSFEEVTSPASPSSSSSSSSTDRLASDPLSDMSSLFQQLPMKRGLSKFYQGKSQSFTSLAKVGSLEDLAKAENPLNKRLKSCKSYGGGLNPSAMSRHVSKRSSCFSSMNARRSSGNFMGSRPPIPAHRSNSTTTIPNQTVLFA